MKAVVRGEPREYNAPRKMSLIRLKKVKTK
jgi:hypothetical protein